MPFNSVKNLGETFRLDDDGHARMDTKFVEFLFGESISRGKELFTTIQESLFPAQLVHLDIFRKLPLFDCIKLFSKDSILKSLSLQILDIALQGDIHNKFKEPLIF